MKIKEKFELFREFGTVGAANKYFEDENRQPTTGDVVGVYEAKRMMDWFRYFGIKTTSIKCLVFYNHMNYAREPGSRKVYRVKV